MWIISDKGFVSLVQHDEDPHLIRARARRKQHLLDTFPNLDEADVIDYGPTPPDYRWHANVDREEAADAIAESVMDMTYTSHVKEAVSDGDMEMYRAMMSAWNAFYELQSPRRTDGDWWISRNAEDDDDDWTSCVVLPSDEDEIDDDWETPSRRTFPTRTFPTRPAQRPRGRGFNWADTRPKRDDGRADKPLEELTGSLADRMLQSAGRINRTDDLLDNADRTARTDALLDRIDPRILKAPAKKAAAKAVIGDKGKITPPKKNQR